MAHRRGRFHRSDSVRRLTSWELGPGDGSVSLTSTSPTVIGSGAQLIQAKATLVRVRGNLFVSLLSAAAAGDSMRGAVGIGIVEEQAFATGQAAMPSPIDEQDWDGWIWWKNWSVLSVTDAEALGQVSAWMFEIDSKAMRKMELGDTIFASAQVSSESGTVTAVCVLDSRILIKLA